MSDSSKGFLEGLKSLKGNLVKDISGLFTSKEPTKEEKRKKFKDVKPVQLIKPTIQFGKSQSKAGGLVSSLLNGMANATKQSATPTVGTSPKETQKAVSTESPHITEELPKKEEPKTLPSPIKAKVDNERAEEIRKTSSALSGSSDETEEKTSRLRSKKPSDLSEDEEELDHLSKRMTFDTDRAKADLSDWRATTPEELASLSPEGYFRHKDIARQRELLRKKFLESARKNGREPTEEELEKEYNKQMYANDITSTAISRAVYNPKTKEFKVQFNNGKYPSSKIWYSYPNVPSEVVQKFKDAVSKGEFFLANIHDKYTTNPGHRRKR